MGRLKQEVDWFADRKIELVVCCDANFGMLTRDVDLAKYVASKKRQTGFPQILNVQNSKNATERVYETQKILSDAGLSAGVGLSMQSLDPLTLTNIRRDNISLGAYFDLQHRFARDGVDTYCDLILGLPGETYELFAEGTSRLIETGQHNRIRFNNLTILPNSEMGDPVYRKKHQIATVLSKIIIPGQPKEPEDDVDEVQDIVISTATMPMSDWRRARVFAWMTAMLHFNRLLQIPLVIAHELAGVSYRTLIEATIDADASLYPVVAEIRDVFMAQARSIQSGGAEYPYSDNWLHMYWPMDEYTFIKLTSEKKLDQFLHEAFAIIRSFFNSRGNLALVAVMDDAFKLNHALIKQPFICSDIAVTTDYNVMQFWQSILMGNRQAFNPVRTITWVARSKAIYADFAAWCKEVVRQGKQKGDYLYDYHAEECVAAQTEYSKMVFEPRLSTQSRLPLQPERENG